MGTVLDFELPTKVLTPEELAAMEAKEEEGEE
jgi:hypothetical protein